MLVKTDLTIFEMTEMIIQTVEPVYTNEATERSAKILDSTYEKSYL